MIDHSEHEDFEQEIRYRGLELADFELVESRKTVIDTEKGEGSATSAVMIRRLSTGAKRIYQTGHRTAWVIAFTNDLKNGRFA